MRRQGPDPEGSRFGSRSHLPGASGAAGGSAGFARRIAPLGRRIREGHIRAISMKAPGLSHPSARLGARVIRRRCEESSRENLLRWRGSPPSRSSGPTARFFRSGHRICRSGRRVTGNHRITSRPPVPYPCRPAEASAPAAAKQRSHEPRCHSPKAPRAPQQRACVSCEISVHKDAKAAQLIPSFLHNSKHDGGHAEFRSSQGRLIALT
jgi:hypothetical protein